MDVFNQMESHVLRLISEAEQMKQESSILLQNAVNSEAELDSLKEENRLLKEALIQEQQIKDNVLKRVDGLLERLKDLEQA